MKSAKSVGAFVISNSRYINNIYEESDEEFDDLLNDEFFEADMLLDIIERFRFLRK